MNGSAGRAMRVLLYADSPIFSGAEAVLCDVARGLAEKSTMAVSAVSPHSNELLTEGISAAIGARPQDVPAQGLRGAAAHLYDRRRRRALAQVLGTGEWDVMLVNMPSAELGMTPMRIPRSSRPPVLGLLHIAGSFRELGFRLGGLRERLSGRLLRRADAVCVLSESAATSFARIWRDDAQVATHVIRLPRAQVERRSRSEARAALGLADGTLVGMAGRISFKQKGQDTFASAAALMLERDPSLRFVVAGEGQDDRRLRSLIAELCVEERFQLLGQVDIGAFLSAIDAIAIPSRFEGLPLVALEALAVGVPGIAADIDGLRDIWPARWLVAPGEPAALAAALGEMLTAPSEEKGRLVDAGREAARRRTTEDVAAELEPLLSGLVR